MTLLGLLIVFLVIAVIVVGAKYLLDMMELPAPLRSLAMLVIFVVALVFMLSYLGGGGPGIALR